MARRAPSTPPRPCWRPRVTPPWAGVRRTVTDRVRISAGWLACSASTAGVRCLPAADCGASPPGSDRQGCLDPRLQRRPRGSNRSVPKFTLAGVEFPLDRLNRSGKRRMSPTAAMNVAATITFDAWNRHQPLDLRPRQRLGGDQLLDLADLRIAAVGSHDVPRPDDCDAVLSASDRKLRWRGAGQIVPGATISAYLATNRRVASEAIGSFLL
jgi:hypothetical protein